MCVFLVLSLLCPYFRYFLFLLFIYSFFFSFFYLRTFFLSLSLIFSRFFLCRLYLPFVCISPLSLLFICLILLSQQFLSFFLVYFDLSRLSVTLQCFNLPAFLHISSSHLQQAMGYFLGAMELCENYDVELNRILSHIQYLHIIF